MKRVLMIINPRAGKNSKRLDTGEIVKAFQNRDIECFEKTTTCQGDAVRIAEKYSAEYDAIVCCGGDGTYNEVINGMMKAGTNIPIIYLPYGSTNDFANTLGITKDPEKAVEMFLDNMIHRYDVGKFNDKYFSYIAEVFIVEFTNIVAVNHVVQKHFNSFLRVFCNAQSVCEVVCGAVGKINYRNICTGFHHAVNNLVVSAVAAAAYNCVVFR